MKQAFFIMFIVFLCSCNKKSIKEEKWEMPENEFPTVFKQIESYELVVHKVEVKAKSLVFGCIERNDYPHYWCDIEAELKNPDPKLPKMIHAVYMSSRPKKFTENHKRLIEKLQNSKTSVYLTSILPSPTKNIDKKNKTKIFLATYFSIENGEYCQNWYDFFDDCPKGTKHIVL